jgi:uncharacterized protein (UPF0332 family)
VTKENRKKNISIEIARAEESLRAAETLVAAGLNADAVSRAYYAAFHFARALLLTIAEEPKSHGGVDRLVQREFVRTGQMPPEIGLLLSRLQAYRSDADYAADHVFTREAAETELSAAKRFIEHVRRLLQEGKWT